jgi:hypothetical protein
MGSPADAENRRQARHLNLTCFSGGFAGNQSRCIYRPPAGLSRMTFHDLRHSYATGALRAGVSPKRGSRSFHDHGADFSWFGGVYSVSPRSAIQPNGQLERISISPPQIVPDGAEAW